MKDVDVATLRHLYEQMARIRGFEEAVSSGYRTGLLPGLLHLSIGSEAVAVGITSCLDPDDRIYSGHRPHGHFIAAGTDPRALMAELAGRDTGICRGRGGSMHLSDDRAMTATGVVGGTLAIALGHALHVAPGHVVVAFFGDGAVQTGAFHETMNMAALWHAPLLFVCENNGMAEFSTRDEHTPVASVASYGSVYGITAREIDGGDVEAVIDTAQEFLGSLRAGKGPAIIECRTTRLRPHYEGDLRRQSEEGDPLDRLSSRLIEFGESPERLAAIREENATWATELLETVLRDDPLPDPNDDPTLVFASEL